MKLIEHGRSYTLNIHKKISNRWWKSICLLKESSMSTRSSFCSFLHQENKSCSNFSLMSIKELTQDPLCLKISSITSWKMCIRNIRKMYQGQREWTSKASRAYRPSAELTFTVKKKKKKANLNRARDQRKSVNHRCAATTDRTDDRSCFTPRYLI